MIPYAQELGQRIDQAWIKHSYQDEIFPQLALDAMQRYPPIENTSVEEIVDWSFSPYQEFRQPHQVPLFGEPPLMLFQASRFYIEALFWLEATTSIHEHAFSGAFSVLAGSSVHSHWSFTPEQAVNSRMICGRLERISTEILRPGDMRPIHAGCQLIHQLFHLDLPSVTIVIRTDSNRARVPQYRYLPPGLAVDPDGRDELLTRRLVLLDGMARGKINGLRKYTGRLIDSGDQEVLFHIFSTLTRRNIDRRVLEDLYGSARERHGEIVDFFRKVCEGERRIRMVAALRAKVHDPEARFLLALLMLLPDRDAILETIRLQFPSVEPLVAIERWLEGMAGKETIGFELTDKNRLIFRSLVEGLDTEGILERLRLKFQAESVDAHRDRLLDHAKQLARLDLFQPLLSKSPLRELHGAPKHPALN